MGRLPLAAAGLPSGVVSPPAERHPRSGRPSAKIGPRDGEVALVSQLHQFHAHYLNKSRRCLVAYAKVRRSGIRLRIGIPSPFLTRLLGGDKCLQMNQVSTQPRTGGGPRNRDRDRDRGRDRIACHLFRFRFRFRYRYRYRYRYRMIMTRRSEGAASLAIRRDRRRRRCWPVSGCQPPKRRSACL